MFPKKIHMTCKNKDTFDDNNTWKKCFEKYKEIYSDYEIILYDDNDIYEIIKEFFPEDYIAITKIKGVMLADIFRYIILYLKGGIYSDLDCLPIKHIDGLFDDIFYHGDKNRNNSFYIYPEEMNILNKQWDFYINPCDNHELLCQTHISSYKCLGHKYINKNTNIIICKEYFEHPDIFKNNFNSHRLCQWFIVAKPNQQIFLDCYKESINNMKENYNAIIELHNINNNEYFCKVLENTGPIFFTKIINKNLPNKDICILPSDFFCCGSGSSIKNFVPLTQNTYVKHLFGGTWV
jgi:mannosyltransferase OCH1-like enzyme